MVVGDLLIEILGCFVDLEMKLPSFVLDIEYTLVYPQSNASRWINSEAKVLPLIRPVPLWNTLSDRIGDVGNFEFFDDPFASQNLRGRNLADVSTPDPISTFRVCLVHVVFLITQLVGQPRILLPSRLVLPRIFRRVENESRVRCIVLLIWIERDPDFRTLLTNRWNEDGPRFFCDAFCFLNPTDVDCFQRLD